MPNIEPQGNIDNTYRSPPGGPKGDSLDPSVLANVQKVTKEKLWSKSDYNWGTSELGNQQNQGAQGSQDNAQKRAKNVKAQNNPQFIQPNNATIAAASPARVLDALKQVDPSNKSGAIKKALDAMIQLNRLAGSSSPGGVDGIVSGALGSALSTVANQLGLGAVTSVTSALSSGVSNTSVAGALNQALTGFLTGTGAGTFGPTSGAGNNAALATVISATPVGSAFNVNAVTPNGARVRQTIVVTQADGTLSTLDGTETQSIASAMSVPIANTITQAIKSGDVSTLIGLIEAMFVEAQRRSQLATTGSDTNNILQDMFSIIPEVAPIIESVVSGLANTLNNQQNVTALQQESAMVLSLAKRVWDTSHMFQGTGAEQSADVAGAHALSMSGLPTGSTQTLTTPSITVTSTVLQPANSVQFTGTGISFLNVAPTQQMVFNAAPVSVKVPSLTDLDDVDVLSLANGATLVYDTSTGKFEVEQQAFDFDGGDF